MRENDTHTEYWDNGKKKAEGTCKRDGLWTWWDENGRKSSEQTYKKGESDGKHIEWYENGQKETETTYKDNHWLTMKAWDKYGNEKMNKQSIWNKNRK